jgi:hypothetical protein
MKSRDCRFVVATRVLIALSISLSAAAQNTASIQGSAVDSASGKAIPGAVVIASRTTAPAARGV